MSNFIPVIRAKNGERLMINPDHVVFVLSRNNHAFLRLSCKVAEDENLIKLTMSADEFMVLLEQSRG